MNKKNRLEKQLEKIDAMSGLEFEKFVANLLRKQGYKTQNLKDSGDFGVDVIARKGGVKYAIQVKRYKGSVSRSAVSDAVAGQFHWKCDKPWVFTSSYFTVDAKTLAESTNCKLTDRDDLTNMLYEQKMWGSKVRQRRKQTFAGFMLVLALLGLVGIFLISQNSPKTWTTFKIRFFTPAKTFVQDLPSRMARALKINNEAKPPDDTLIPIENDPPKTPKLDEDGVPILQPID